jgi:predicted amidohydrolase YtcJ
VSGADPLAAIHVAVNRIRPDLVEQPFLPAQRLALADAYTAGSACANGLDETGRIDAGQLADLVVLDRDLDAVLPGELAQLRVEQTFVGGRRVYGV